MDKVRIAIIGGRGMLKKYLPAVQEAGAIISCLTTSCPETAKQAAEKHGIPQIESYAGLMSRAKEIADGVIVSVPNWLHARMTTDALKAGLDVLCEKPPACNAAEAEQMADTAEKTGQHLLLDFKMRGQEEAEWLKYSIVSGNAGKVLSADAQWARRHGIPGQGGWFTNKAKAGGGALMDLGCHVLDLALWLMDYPDAEYVSATTADNLIRDPQFAGPWPLPKETERFPIDVENWIKGMVTLKGNKCLTFEASWASQSVAREIVAVKFEGALGGGMMERLFTPADGFYLNARDRAEYYTQQAGKAVNCQLKVQAPDPIRGVKAVIDNFVRVIRGEAEPLTNPQEAVKLMRIIDAAYASAARKCPIEVGSI